MIGWHHRLDGHEFGWSPGVCDGQGALTCCGSWGRKELDTTERLNCTELAQLSYPLCFWLAFLSFEFLSNSLSTG